MPSTTITTPVNSAPKQPHPKNDITSLTQHPNHNTSASPKRQPPAWTPNLHNHATSIEKEKQKNTNRLPHDVPSPALCHQIVDTRVQVRQGGYSIQHSGNITCQGPFPNKVLRFTQLVSHLQPPESRSSVVQPCTNSLNMLDPLFPFSLSIPVPAVRVPILSCRVLCRIRMWFQHPGFPRFPKVSKVCMATLSRRTNHF